MRNLKTLKTDVEKGIAAFIVLTAIFASLSVLARYLNTDFTILQQVYLRVLVALIMALIVFRKQLRWGRIAHLPAREWFVIAFRSLAIYAIGVTLGSKAATMTLIGHVTFISALPFVPLLGFLFLKEKVTWWKITFVFGALLGVSLLAVKDFHNVFAWSTGDLFAVIATMGFSLAYVTRKWHGDILNNQEITTLTFMAGAGCVLLLSLLFGEGVPKLDSSWALWLVAC